MSYDKARARLVQMIVDRGCDCDEEHWEELDLDVADAEAEQHECIEGVADWFLAETQSRVEALEKQAGDLLLDLLQLCSYAEPAEGMNWRECCCAEVDPSDRPCVVCCGKLHQLLRQLEEQRSFAKAVTLTIGFVQWRAPPVKTPCVLLIEYKDGKRHIQPKLWGRVNLNRGPSKVIGWYPIDHPPTDGEVAT